MADFDTWRFASLVQFAREAQEKLAVLEVQLHEVRATLVECDKDRKDLLQELRRMILKGDTP